MNAENIMTFLLIKIPLIKNNIDDYLIKWDGRSYEDLNLCGKIMTVARIVTDNLKNKKNIKETKKILENIESYLIKCGDTDLENSLEVCFFETIINPLTHDQEDIDQSFKLFVSLLGKESIKLCQQNDKFWGTKSPFLYTLET